MERFLIKDSGVFVFCGKDPRVDGYVGEVQVVVLEEEHNSHLWRGGEPKEPDRVLGVNPYNPNHFRYFLDLENLVEDEFLVVEQIRDVKIVITLSDYLASKKPR